MFINIELIDVQKAKTVFSADTYSMKKVQALIRERLASDQNMGFSSIRQLFPDDVTSTDIFSNLLYKMF